MSASETGLMATRESMAFTMNLHQQTPSPSTQAQPMIQNMQIPYVADGNSLYKPVNSTSPPPQQYQTNSTAACDNGSSLDPVLNMNTINSEIVKKKRGRPRKYGPDGAMSLAPFTISQPSGERTSSSYKKMRGRPPGSSKKRKLQTLGSTGLGFTPHVLTVRTGEDVTSKIMSFSQNGARTVCVLSANGAISNVTLRQLATSGGTVTYEGRFEILSLTGSFLLLEHGGHRSRTGGLSVSLSDVDGNVLGGGVAGLLIAASPVQIVVGSFIADGEKEVKNVSEMEVPGLAPTQVLLAPRSPQSRGTMSESSGPGSPLNQSRGVYTNTSLSMPWK